MKIEFKPRAEDDFLSLEKKLQGIFENHLKKLLEMSPRRHLCFGMPYYVEDVTQSARIVYDFEGDVIYVIRCFSNHKDYERWYLAFK